MSKAKEPIHTGLETRLTGWGRLIMALEFLRLGLFTRLFLNKVPAFVVDGQHLVTRTGQTIGVVFVERTIKFQFASANRAQRRNTRRIYRRKSARKAANDK